MAETLTNVSEVDQSTLLKLYDYTIKNGENLIVFGPSGGGKTEMAQQAISNNGYKMVYVNLSVMERPDIQGWPKLSEHSIEAEYSIPHFLPTFETRFLREKNDLQNAKKYLESNSVMYNAIVERLNEIAKYEEALALKKITPILSSLIKEDKTREEFLKQINDSYEKYGKQSGVVILFDELDKAPKEVLQPLLEILQLHTLNGRPLNIQACLMTANLPDEHAHTENLSHAITNRCSIYKLSLNFDCWRDWAISNRVHPLIIGFLSSHKDYLHKKASNHDDTAYAYCSPRSWTSASKSLYAVEDDTRFAFLNDEEKIDFIVTLIAGKVGSEAASKFELWLKYYHKLDPIVDSIVEHGEMRNIDGSKYNIDNMELDEKLVCAISACSRLNAEFKPDNKDRLYRITKNIFTWLSTIDSETQIAAVRNTLDFEIVKKYELMNIKEFMAVFTHLNKVKHTDG